MKILGNVLNIELVYFLGGSQDSVIFFYIIIYIYTIAFCTNLHIWHAERITAFKILRQEYNFAIGDYCQSNDSQEYNSPEVFYHHVLANFLWFSNLIQCLSNNFVRNSSRNPVQV